MALGVIRDVSRGSNQSRESGGEGIVTPKYGNNESSSPKPVNFSIEDLIMNQPKPKTGVKAEDIEKIVEKVGMRLRKTKGILNSETINVISTSKMFEGSIKKLTGGLEYQVYKDKLALSFPSRTKKLFSLYQSRHIKMSTQP